MSKLLFTVFTPTYNRAHTLGRVYQSLLAQTFKNFEWLIVDDGSSDGTEELVNGFTSEGRIAIRYFQQPNGGKHVAFNRGVCEARGELFLALDSDDACSPVALERFHARWFSIPDSNRMEFSGITCLSEDVNGNVIGGNLPLDFIDGYPYHVTSRYRLKGDKWGFHQTRILKNYLFPVFPAERFVPESLIWNRIGRVYKIRFVNEALHKAYYQKDGLSASSVKIRRSSPNATFLYYSEAINIKFSVKLIDRLRMAVNLWRFALHSKQWPRIFKIRRHFFLLMFGFFGGLAFSLIDKIKWRN